MILVNETSLPAILLSTVIDEERIAASVVVRVTYALGGSTLAIADEQTWPVAGAPTKTPHGTMEAETPFMKGGVDLFLFGTARAPKKVPVSEMQVTIEVGDFVRRVNVFGERIWVRRDGKRLQPSRPGVFLEMPLALTHAFGGTAEWDGLTVPCMENPAGKGLYLDEDAAVGQPLPNLQEPDSPVTEWNDSPAICGLGFCPLQSAARFRNGWSLTDDRTEIDAVRPQSLNTAYPPMIAPQVKPGDAVRVHGVLHEGPLAFTVPAPPAHVRLRFGANVVTRAPSVDQIGVLPDEGRVFVSYRFPFRYTIRPREQRSIHLIPGASPP